MTIMTLSYAPAAPRLWQQTNSNKNSLIKKGNLACPPHNPVKQSLLPPGSSTRRVNSSPPSCRCFPLRVRLNAVQPRRVPPATAVAGLLLDLEQREQAKRRRS